jgi:hypothetical protein
MTNAGIRITRYPYEEPYHLNLHIAASNGRVAGDLEYYCNANDLGILGKKLVGFAGRNAVVYAPRSPKTVSHFSSACE